MSGWDAHAHLVPEGVLRAAAVGQWDMAIGDGRLAIGAHRVPLGRIAEPAHLLARLDGDGLDGAIVSIPPPLFRPELATTDARAAYAGLVNDALLDTCRVAPRRLRPLAYLPLEDPALATRLAARLGPDWAGVVAGSDLRGLSHADPALADLWGVLESARLPLFIHPSASGDARLDAYYLGNLVGNPMETTIVAAQLVMGGVLERHPGLRVLLAHGGGAIAALAGRLQRGKDTMRPGLPADLADPLAAVRRLYVDTIVHSPEALALILAVLGEDRVLLGSDWPFPMGAPDDAHDIGHLPQALQHRLRAENVHSLFGERLRGGQGEES